MSKAVYVIEVKTPEHPRVLFFARNGAGEGKAARFQELSSRVARLELASVDGEARGEYWLRRLGAAGEAVWQTRHPSLKEAFIQAEWEYGVGEGAWRKV